MNEDFFLFVLETTEENFKNSQDEVFNHLEYSGYSNDLQEMFQLLEEDRWEEVSNYYSINTILSPRAHLYKNYALEKLEDEEGAKGEMIMAYKIMEGIETTGKGTLEEPFRVTYISDEKDMLNYFNEEFKSQELIYNGNSALDKITCVSGKSYYFDVSTPFQQMKQKTASKN